MLNPNEIAGKRFDKTMGRYRPEEVEGYLRQVADEMNALIAEKRDLENKLMLLAEKLEEYRQDEESLRSALIGAQKLGDSVVRDAKAKAAEIIEDGKNCASLLMENAKHAVEAEQTAYARLQREVATFKSKLQLIYKQHLEQISSIPVDQDFLTATAASEQAAKAAAPARPAAYDHLAEQLDISSEYEDEVDEEQSAQQQDEPDTELRYSERPLEYSVESAYDEPEPEPEADPKRDSRFGPLKFGKDFNIRDDKRKK